MTPSAAHGTFCLERTYPASPARVFAAFSDIDAKALWFGGPPGEWTLLERHLDFRVGGTERARGQWPSGKVSDFQARYFDITPGERIIYAYEMFLDDKKISVSLATVEITPEGAGTHLRVTEQGVFIDGYDDAGSREQGTAELLERIGQTLKEPA